jgi:excinuclease ABC subunit C
MLSTPDEIFAGFGPSAFLPKRRPFESLDVARDRRELRRRLRAACPTEPGVYGMIDSAGRLIYVGVSRHLQQRLVTYFQGAESFERPPHRADQPRKELRISRRAVRLVWEVAGHELLALLREHELIRRFKPDLNVRGRRRRRLAYIVISTDAAPRFRVAGELPKSCRHRWGPFPHNGRLLRSVELLNRHFKLPDCPSHTPMHFAGDGALFPIVHGPLCLRGEVDRCLAPCIGAGTHRDYFAQLARARAFLDGVDNTPLAELNQAISAAVAHRQFERAARLNEFRTDLESLRERLVPRPLEEPRSFVYPVQLGRRLAWLLICHGAVLAVGREPHSSNTARRWLAQLENLNPAAASIDDRDAGEPRIVYAWFRQHPAELERVLSFECAREVCRRLSV